MPEGSDEQKNLMGEPAETANLLAADKAKSSGELRTADADNYEPYPDQPEDASNTPDGGEEEQNAEAEQEEERNTQAQQQAQLVDQEQAEVAIAMAAGKQRQMRQIQMEKQKLEEQLSELEKDLTDFRHSKLGGFFKIFQPRIDLLIDILIEQIKKQTSKLADEAKIAYYTTLIVTVTSLI